MTGHGADRESRRHDPFPPPAHTMERADRPRSPSPLISAGLPAPVDRLIGRERLVTDLSEPAIADQLVTIFDQRDLVLVLHNFEHLLPAAVAGARAALTPAAMATAWNIGAAMPLDDAIAAVRAAAAGPRPQRDELGLTRRERDVLRLLVAGESDPRIAAGLSISVRTVESHVAQVVTKLGAGSRTRAVARAVYLGLTERCRGRR